MLKAVTNKDFPMLREALSLLFNVELEYDPDMKKVKNFSTSDFIRFMTMGPDPHGRIRIFFIEGTDDLSNGMFKNTDIIGFNMVKKKLVFVAIPSKVEPISEECDFMPRSMESYLLAVTLHELYENLTGDVSHCHNPGKCINSICKLYDNGTCCVCMAGLIETRYPDITLEDLFCEEDLGLLKEALRKYERLEAI
ncbi:hypothetical protein CUJ83_06865 [Methanocella sp. CWC-04]|uniref:Uncharacterized protein n=1 Tax=Methanooceanicella nereidis TaxID=2052831 RepID=A0AAP2W5W2_9EURY|nr:hypothetical protein [Methanocella sp. CWC-04]MCD1294718.1 hypothetical protein [Methanocella sp. CWC-04]